MHLIMIMENKTMRQTKELTFSGEHSRLITGASYSIYAIALITGISNATLYRRLKGRDEVTEWDITPASERNPERYGNKGRDSVGYRRLEPAPERLSAEWLRLSI